jgi:hypothetical protein
MKLIVEEHQIKTAFFHYMESMHPEYKNLKKHKITRNFYGHDTIVGWKFRNDDGDEFFRFIKDKNEIILTYAFWDEIKSVFGEEFMEYIIDWVNINYGLNAESMTF